MFHGKSSALQKEKHPTKYQVLSSACAIGGGDKRDRTADLLNAIQALSQVIRLRTPGILKVRVQLAAWKWKQS